MWNVTLLDYLTFSVYNELGWTWEIVMTVYQEAGNKNADVDCIFVSCEVQIISINNFNNVTFMIDIKSCGMSYKNKKPS